MPLIRIESLDDPRLAPYRDLRNKQLRTRQGRFIAEGDLVVQRLLESRYAVESLLVAEPQLGRLAIPADVPVYCTTHAMVEELAGFRFHRGILGCGIRSACSDWWQRMSRSPHPCGVVVCCGVRDPENVGGILRNCAAFGVEMVMIGNHSADPLSRRVLRVSMAACLKLHVYETLQLAADLRRLREEFAVDLSATVLAPTARQLADLCPPARWGLVFGNELAGVAPSTLQQCHQQVTIPMSLQTDSLNVAVASGIFLYHFSQVTNRCKAV